MHNEIQEFKKELVEILESYLTKNDDQYMDLDEAAEFMKISRSTMEKLSANRLLPLYKPNGGKVYFRKSDLIKYIESGRLRSRDEVSNEIISNQKGGQPRWKIK